MKIALIGDIHANLTALLAVMDDIRAQGDIQEIWNLGDALGFCAFPDEVVMLLRNSDIPGIAGNYDRKILKFPDKKQAWGKGKSSEKFSMWRYTFEILSEESISYIMGLPDERRCLRHGWEILLVHGSPESEDENISPGTPESRMSILAEQASADIVLCGHSHIPFVREAGGTTFINPGSIGVQFDGDPRASYAVLTLTKRSMQVSHFRIPYDIQLAAASIREKGLPDVYARMVLSGRGYRDVIAEDTHTGALPDRSLCVKEALELGRSFSFEEGHAIQTTSLALKLFDCLEEIHGLSQQERIMLECAAILHDIGLTKELKGHHKHSMEIIIEHGLSRFSPGETTMIALIARYHRKALPSMKHDRFAALSEPCRGIVMKLSALLRVADGLDRTHRNAVQDVSCTVLPDSIRITCRTEGLAQEEITFGLIKSDLMQVTFDRMVEIGN